MKRFLPVIFLALGACAFSLILHFMNKSKSNNGYVYENKYVAGCEEIQLVMKDFKNSEKEIKGNYTRTGQNSFSANQTVFYDDKYKKYFVIELLFNSTTFDSYSFTRFIELIKPGETITASVNSTELTDPSYGTLQNPVPVFKFSRNDAKDWKTFAEVTNNEGRIDNSKEMDKLYKNSIGIYLTHIKTKEDFKKMFGESQPE